jgi:hypothetical protein
VNRVGLTLKCTFQLTDLFFAYFAPGPTSTAMGMMKMRYRWNVFDRYCKSTRVQRREKLLLLLRRDPVLICF